MAAQQIDIRTADGVVDSHFFTPGRQGQIPGGDLLHGRPRGLRPALLEMGQRLADNGYAVLLPNLYYRHGPASMSSDLMNDRDRMMMLVGSVTNEGTMRDTERFLAFLDTQESVLGERVGCTGYCMGGALSLTAAGTYTDRVAAVASLHGARLATDAPDSPHLLAPQMTGEIYAGVSEIDPYLAPGETDRLGAALKDAGANATVEIYPGVHHGFTVPGIPIYDREGIGILARWEPATRPL